MENYLNQKFSFYGNKIEEKLMDSNKLNFPLPQFLQIFKEQIMEPLNFFQIFSAFLWFFDDSIYHPIMILILLVVSNLGVTF